ncbi:MAG: GntR family transcriptional regulator [Actinobacteria bacterium]|nr:GntR family transcriptional regulator [Actinomycetota bacterium]
MERKNKKNNISSIVSIKKTINRDSYEPAFVQLANILRSQIVSGVFSPANQLPSEAMLCKSYQISPMTVRRAINLLVDLDIVITSKGRGTFVKPLKISGASFHLSDLQNLLDNEAMTVKLLEVRIISTDPYTAERLKIDKEEKTIFIKSLLTINNTPVFYHREFLVYDPTRPIVEAEIDVTSLQGLFNGSGNTIIKWGELQVKPVLLKQEEADILKLPLPGVAFSLQHLFYDFNDKPISWGWFICNTDYLQFITKVGISNE